MIGGVCCVMCLAEAGEGFSAQDGDFGEVWVVDDAVVWMGGIGGVLREMVGFDDAGQCVGGHVCEEGYRVLVWTPGSSERK